MNNYITKHPRLGIILLVGIVCINILFAGLFFFPVNASISGFSVGGLDATLTSGETWTATSTNSLSWSYKSDRSGYPWSYKYTSKTSTLKLTNTSEETKMLSFEYSITLNGGSVTIDGEAYSGSAKAGIPIDAGKSVDIVVTTAASSTGYSKGTTVTLTGITFDVPSITTTFAAPNETMGAYTVDGATITADQEITNPATKSYALKATALDDYVFTGWYLDGILFSTASELSDAYFTASGTVTAVFIPDPLYTITSSESSGYTKDELIDINSRYYHNSKNTLYTGTDSSATNCYYSVAASTGVADDYDVQYVPFLQWTVTDSTIQVSYSGTAQGEWCTGMANSWHRANMVSNVIRIYAKENCNISFDYAQSATCTGSDATNTVNLHVYVADSGSVGYSTIVSKGTVYSEANGTVDCTLSKGQYLYIYMNGQSISKSLKFSAGYGEMDFSYTATISNFTVSYNDVKYIQSTTFQDNMGNPLASGKLTVGTSSYSVGSDGTVSGLEFPDGQTLILSVTAPTNYRLLGWEVDGTLHCQATYTYALSKNTTVNPIFVPNTVTYDADKGTYQYKNISGTWVDANGQYIARNADASTFYTTLAEGFADGTNMVVLLGNMTISGSFTVPSGEMLVVPYDMKETPTGGLPTAVGSSTLRSFATLTISGTATVCGSLMVSGHQNWSTGSPTGTYGTLAVTGTINVENGGVLYGYGLTNGAGTIYAKKGAQVHELVEILDMRHPQTTKALVDDAGTYQIFPFNIFYFNTIEAEVVYSVGATLEGHYSLHYDETTQGSAMVIGTTDSVFLLKEGTVSKYYDRDSGRIVFRVNEGGKAESGIFTTDMNVTFSGVTYKASIDSSDYLLPLCCGYHIQIAGDFTLNHGYKLLPGAKMEVTQTGKLTISEKGCLVLYRLNDYDYRKFDANKDNTEAIGFGVQAYPVNMSRAAVKFTLNNVGSATMHVDGTVIATGGLYVTNQPRPLNDGGYVEETDTVTYPHKVYQYYDNGYNYLTGTGVITMGDASKESIFENLNTSADRNIHATTIAIVPIMGLPEDAQEDSKDLYESLSGTMYGFINEWDVNAWTDDPCVAGRHTDADTDGLCDSCGTLVFYATNVSLGNNLDLLFAFSQTAADTKGAKYVIFTHNGVSKQVDIADWQTATIGNGSYYVVSYGFAAKEMCDYVTVVIYNSEDKAISASKTDSIRDYAMRMLGKLAAAEDETSIYLRRVIVDMLNYGAACQTFFGYNEDNLATNQLTDTQKNYATQADPEVSDFTRENASFWAGTNLVTESNIQFAVAFQGLSAGAKVTYSFTGHKGNSVSGEVKLENLTESNGVYYFVIPELVVADARYEITIKVTSGNTTQTWTESVAAYVARNATNDESGVFMAFMKFADSANYYLHHKYNQEG